MNFELVSKAIYNHYYNCIVIEDIGATQHSMTINLATKKITCGCNCKDKFCKHKLSFIDKFSFYFA